MLSFTSLRYYVIVILQVVHTVDVFSLLLVINLLYFCFFHSYLDDGLLIVFCCGECVVGISKDSIFGVILFFGFG